MFLRYFLRYFDFRKTLNRCFICVFIDTLIPALAPKNASPLRNQGAFFVLSDLQIRQTLSVFMCVKNFLQHTDRFTYLVI